MSKKKNTRSSGSALERGTEQGTSFATASNSNIDFIMVNPPRQMQLLDILQRGAENAVTGEKIAALLDVDMRTVSKLVQIERIQGTAICASNEEPFGYYIAADVQELQSYLRSLRRRLRNIVSTYSALGETLDTMSGQERIASFFEEDI